jgi:hypothetical protein
LVANKCQDTKSIRLPNTKYDRLLIVDNTNQERPLQAKIQGAATAHLQLPMFTPSPQLSMSQSLTPQAMVE